MEDLSLGLTQLQAAKFEYLSEHVCDWSTNPRPFSTIAVMQKGCGRFVASGETVEVTCGQVFFIPAGSRYTSYWHGTEEIIYFAIHFHFDNWYSKFSPQRFCIQKIETLSSDVFFHHFENIRKYVSCDGYERLKAYGSFYHLYAEVLPLLDCAKLKNTALERIRNAVDYIEHNSEKEFTVKYLAQMCHLSESRFYALFCRALGCSPIAYRNIVRIRKALIMLGKQYTIEEIATKVGFSSAIYFRRVFKEIMGRLPSEYRKNLNFNIEDIRRL
jgi:AraC-like DNA-binding protein